MGWTTHGMIGFDRDRAVATLGIPPDFSVDAVYAIGKLGDPGDLPEGLRARERPSGREPLSHLASEGEFPEAARPS